MEFPKLINNINERVVDDLKCRLTAKSKVSIAAASFSILVYSPIAYKQTILLNKVNNVKFDCTSKDLLFQVMLELGATLDCKIEQIFKTYSASTTTKVL